MCFLVPSLIHVFALSESDVDHPAFAFCPWAYISPQDQSDRDAEEEEGSRYRNRRQGSENSSPGLGVEGGGKHLYPSASQTICGEGLFSLIPK